MTSHPFPPAPSSRSRQTSTLSQDVGIAGPQWSPVSHQLHSFLNPFASTGAPSQQPNFVFSFSLKIHHMVHNRGDPIHWSRTPWLHSSFQDCTFLLWSMIPLSLPPVLQGKFCSFDDASQQEFLYHSHDLVDLIAFGFLGMVSCTWSIDVIDNDRINCVFSSWSNTTCS